MNRIALYCLIGCCTWALCLTCLPRAQAQTSKWVKTGVTGRLVYVPDADGDRILDFSMVGYGAGKKPIPTDIPVAIHIDPIAGDNTQHIQNAINFAASRPLVNGFRGVVELGPGKFDVFGRLTINASGVVLRGSGGGDSLATNTHIVSQNRTDSVVGSTPVIDIQGSSSGTTRGPQIQVLDKRVPVGAQSFRVASTAGMSVGGMVEIFRPSTQPWIEALGMHLIPDGKHWSAGDRDLQWHRTITRIEGNRVFIDAPITTALDTQWGGGTIRTFNAPNVIRNIGVENLRGQSLDAREETNELRTPSFVRFTRVADGWVQDVETRHFSYASVFTSEADGTRHITVDNVRSLLPSGVVTGGRRYSFAMDAQYSLVMNSHADSGRHDFVTGSDVVGPIAFVNSTTANTRADAGPHHRWGNGLLFDKITVSGNAINVQNRWTSGSGHGWAGANVVVWNSQANSYIVQSPPTAQSWLIGSTGTINAGNCHLGTGVTCAGYYDSHGTRVSVGGTQSLYEAQVNDAAEIRDFHWTGGEGQWSSASNWDQSLAPAVYRMANRDYLLGDIDNFVHDGAGSVDNAFVDPAWAASIMRNSLAPIVGFDAGAGSQNVAFTIQHQLDPNERVLHAFLAMSLKQNATGSSADDFLQLFDMHPASQFTFSQLGWAAQVNATTPFVGVIDLGAYVDLLQTGSANVLVSNDCGIDWAMYVATVATPVSDATGPRVFLDGGGAVTLDHTPAAINQLQIGGRDGSGQLTLTADARLSVTNDLLQFDNGTLQVELAASSVNQPPLMQVNGLAVLGGTLEILLADGFNPMADQTFQLLTANGGVSLAFQQVLLPSLETGLQWNLLTGPGSVSLQVASVPLNGIAGDVNQDGVVDQLDVEAFVAGWMTTGHLGDFHKYIHGDLNLDGFTDLLDVFILHQALAAGQGSGFPFELLNSPTVPEPATHCLGSISIVGLALLARRSRGPVRFRHSINFFS
ncbi:MAG: hypothetical protein WD738_04915 [Pirellulales bacterium]